jgi:hypothetical protein
MDAPTLSDRAENGAAEVARVPRATLMRYLGLAMGGGVLVGALLKVLTPGHPSGLLIFGFTLGCLGFNTAIALRLRQEGRFRLPASPEEDERDAAEWYEAQFRERTAHPRR